MLPKRSVGILHKKEEVLSIAAKTFIDFMVGQKA